MYVGRIARHKGIHYLIEALESSWELEVVGRVYDSVYFEDLKARSRGKRVQFLTEIDDTELVKKYQTARVLVQASVHEDGYGHSTEVPELLGLVTLEAMACGTPVIVSDAGSLPELLEEGVEGFVVEQNNPQALREKIAFLMQNDECAQRMGSEGRRRVLRQFQWKTVAERCLHYYVTL